MGLLLNFVLKGKKPKKSGHLSFHEQERKETEKKQPEGLEEKPGAWAYEGQGGVSDALGS